VQSKKVRLAKVAQLGVIVTIWQCKKPCITYIWSDWQLHTAGDFLSHPRQQAAITFLQAYGHLPSQRTCTSVSTRYFFDHPLTSNKWQRHIGVNNLPEVVMQLCPDGNRTHNLLITSAMPYRHTTAPPIASTVFCAYQNAFYNLYSDERWPKKVTMKFSTKVRHYLYATACPSPSASSLVECRTPSLDHTRSWRMPVKIVKSL